jgi:hypothetical protein
MRKQHLAVGRLTGIIICLALGRPVWGRAPERIFPWMLNRAFSPGPFMKTARMWHLQTTLPNGRVVAFGGHGEGFHCLNTADVWSPSTKKFTTLNMIYYHDFAAFAKLLNGRYLLAGGAAYYGVPAYATSEIYNPNSNAFSATGSMVRFRAGAGAATLNSGKVLIAGGWWIHNDAHTYGEIYDPVKGTFAATGPLKVPRAYPVLFPTKDGKAIVAGGQGPQGTPGYIEKVELYNPVTNKFAVYRNTLIAGKTGWFFYQYKCMRAIDDQKMGDGRYLMTALKAVTGGYQVMLVAFDPVKKVFTSLETTPPLPAWSQVAISLAPIVDRQKNKAYLLGTQPATAGVQSQVLYTVDLATMALTADAEQLSTDYYSDFGGQSLLKDGRILMTGGTKDGTNFKPVANTIYVKSN